MLTSHHIPNQTKIATEEFCRKSLLRKQNEIDFIDSRIQILLHLKIVQVRVLILLINSKKIERMCACLAAKRHFEKDKCFLYLKMHFRE